MPSPLITAAQNVLRAQCRRHRDRALRQLDAAVHAELTQSDPFGQLLADMAVFLEEQSDDPLAVELVERARALGVLGK